MTCSPETPLYNHPLPAIEDWLRSLGCQQDSDELNHWTIHRNDWQADLWMEIDCFVVSYHQAAEDGSNLERSFKYSLSRQDVESAIFAGP
jgi:hypothetical protein